MKVYIKLISVVLALAFVLTGVSLLGVSAEDSAYIQPEKFIYGDVDLDGTVTVKDATLIQKGLANITYVTAVQKYLADPESTGYSIKNATAIQKYLANYETTTPWGEELVMASQDEFSGDVWENGVYKGTYILVYPKTNISYDYALEDFPEYSFSKIEKKLRNSTQTTYYKLYLEAPSKDSAIEALKALDYRANIDLKHIMLDYSIPLD